MASRSLKVSRVTIGLRLGLIGVCVLLFGGCSGTQPPDIQVSEPVAKASPSPTVKPSPTSMASLIPTPTLEPTPSPTLTPTPSPTPTAAVASTPWPTYVATTTTAWPRLPPIRPDVAARLAAGDRQREEWARQGIDQLRKTEPELAAKIIDLPWIGDGIGRSEYGAVRGLTNLAIAGLANDLIEESWVVEGRNYPALHSLWYLSRDSEKLTRGMTHPNFSDGITEQEAKILATLHPVEDSDLLDMLLDAELVTLEERNITLPLAGEIELTVIRTGAPIDYAMDSLEHAVRNIEEFMGVPLPIRQVIVRFDNGLGGRGVNYATFVSVGI